MSKLLPGTQSNGYGHRIRREGFNMYVISWRYDYRPSGCRYRFVKGRERDTNRKGAERFAKKHGITFDFPPEG